MGLAAVTSTSSGGGPGAPRLVNATGGSVIMTGNNSSPLTLGPAANDPDEYNSDHGRRRRSHAGGLFLRY